MGDGCRFHIWGAPDIRWLGHEIQTKKGLLAMTYSPRGLPPKYHRR